jgi:hypothetical protein
MVKLDEEALGLIFMGLGAMVFTFALAWAWAAH